MKQEILLARSGNESRGAVVTDGALTDYRAERAEAPSLVGGVYRARVKKVLAGLAGAIVELPAGEAWLDLSRARGAKAREGAILTVEIVQDAQPGKLPRASVEPVLAGRFLALQPFAAKHGLSHRIGDNDARARLGALLGVFAKEGARRFLALHRAPAASDAMLRHEAQRLAERWRAAAPKLEGEAVAEVLPPSDPALDLLRLFVGPTVARVAVDNEALAAEVRAWLAAAAPEWKGAVEREPVGRARLDSSEIKAALEEALAPEVPLLGGGTLVIESAAGLTAIDVDTDRAAAASAKANFARVNREAAREIARQMRLRNLGGRIVADFAGLGEARELPAVIALLRGAVAQDPMAVQIARPSELGLVELMRRRERRPLAEMLGVS
jgi:Rne/Rng family ribonuclease